MSNDLSVEITGLDELGAKLDSIPDKFAKRIQRVALKAGGGVVAADMRARCPVSPVAAHKDSAPGELRDSIGVTVHVDKDLGSSVAQVGPQYTKGLHEDSTHDPGVYGRWVEFGRQSGSRDGKTFASVQGPEPFIRPAYEATKETAVEAYAKTANALIDLLVEGGKE